MIEISLQVDGEKSIVLRDLDSFLSALQSDGVTVRGGMLLHGLEFNRVREPITVPAKAEYRVSGTFEASATTTSLVVEGAVAKRPVPAKKAKRK